MDPSDRWLFLFLRGVPCAWCCRHCDFAATGTGPTVPLERMIELSRPLADSRGGSYGSLAVSLGDCALNHPELPGWVSFLEDQGVEGGLSLPADGFRSRDDREWSEFLESIREAGTQLLELTLYGQGETHDRFARMRGAYEETLRLASLWDEVGGRTLWSAVAHRGNLSELAALREETPGPVILWSHLGYGTGSEDLRLEERDLESLTAELREELDPYRPEREWAATLSDCHEPPFERHPRVIHLAIDAEGVARVPYAPAAAGLRGPRCGTAPPDSVADLLEALDRRREDWRARFPSVARLATGFGDPKGTRLHDRSSVIRKWCGRFEVDAASRRG